MRSVPNEYDMKDIKFLAEYIGMEQYPDDIHCTWKKRFAFLPHICVVSGKWLWFKSHYKLTTYDPFPAEGTKIEVDWIDNEIGLIIQMMI